jgi:hypothetical protein
MAIHDVQRAGRARELHEQATAAGISDPASLAVALDVMRQEGWEVLRVDASDDDAATVVLRKIAKPVPRAELAEHVRELRAQGLSYRMVGRRLERAGVAAPHGGGTWHPSSVRWVERR